MGLFGRFRTPDAAKMAAAGDVDGLIQALGYKKAEVVEAAARGLGQLKARRAIDPLVAVMVGRDTWPPAARAAGQALRVLLSGEEAYRVADILDYRFSKEKIEDTAVAQQLRQSGCPDLKGYEDDTYRWFNEATLRAIAYLRLEAYAYLMPRMWYKARAQFFIDVAAPTESLLEEMGEAAYGVLLVHTKDRIGSEFSPRAKSILGRKAREAVEYALEHLYDPQDRVAKRLVDLVNDPAASLTSEQRQALAAQGIEAALVRLDDPEGRARTNAAYAINQLNKALPAGSPLIAHCRERLERLVAAGAGESAYWVYATLIALGKVPTPEEVLQQRPVTSYEAALLFSHIATKGCPLPQPLVEDCLRRCLDETYGGRLRPDESKGDSLAIDTYFTLLQALGGARSADISVRYWIWKRKFDECVKDGEAAAPYLVDYLGCKADYYRGPTGYFAFTISDMAERALFKIGEAALQALYDAAVDSETEREKARAAINVIANIPYVLCGPALDDLLKRGIYPEDVKKALDYRKGRPYLDYGWVI